jgi:hypothetical protein
MEFDQILERKLEKLVSGLLHPRIEEPLTRALLDEVEVQIYAKCGLAIGLMLHDEYVTWQGPSGTYHHIHWS